jgi:hypothetical protein
MLRCISKDELTLGLPEDGQVVKNGFLHQTAPSPHSEASWMEDAWLWLVLALGIGR